MATSGWPVLGANSPSSMTPGSGACAKDSSRAHRFSTPALLTMKLRLAAIGVEAEQRNRVKLQPAQHRPATMSV